MPYQVIVADNFHYMDEDEQYLEREFADADVAVAYCRGIVVAYLETNHKPGMTAEELWRNYTGFGEDPFIVCVGVPEVRFSAWTYAKERCQQMCAGEIPAHAAPTASPGVGTST